MKGAQEEVRRAIGKKERVEESDLHQYHYLKLVIKEALRLHHPTPLLVPRETIEKCTIGGYQILLKTRVFVNARAIAMDPKYWDNPEEFWPDRFLNNPIDFRGQDLEFLPFRFGRRGCPGLNFSMVVIELTLANLLHCFDWQLPHGMKREDVDMEEAVGITMHKKTHLCLVAIAKAYNA
ncbi:cytochrome P450 71A9-like [Magnolia sinica]|uniref:cytochrome P450 71A9-like n=1 Tax=Magnolia sinica TaxID=86752 RepID=UPI002658B2D8|nr:cytochrome P450 71A9-like [Magnolia sinica]